jgi:hypothetical protein
VVSSGSTDSDRARDAGFATFASAPPVSSALFGVTAPFFHVPTEAKGWSNLAVKYTR